MLDSDWTDLKTLNCLHSFCVNVLLSTILIEPVAILIEPVAKAILIEPTICGILNFKLLCRKSVCVSTEQYSEEQVSEYGIIRLLEEPDSLQALCSCAMFACLLSQPARQVKFITVCK